MTKENDLDIKDEDLKEEDFSPEELESEDVNWKEKSQELKGIAKRRATQLSKAKEKLANMADLEKELADLKKTSPPDKKVSSHDSELLSRVDKLALQVAGIVHEKEVELFNKWKESTGRGPELIVNNDIFKSELQKIRDDTANENATSDLKGGGAKGNIKESIDYWRKENRPPTPEDVPDNKKRGEIIAQLIGEADKGKIGFYNT